MKFLTKRILGIFLGIGSLVVSYALNAEDKPFTISQPITQNTRFEINAYCQDKKTGYIQYEKTGNQSWKIHEVYTAAEYRNKGLGTMLISHCITHITQNGCEKLEFDVMPIDPNGPTVEQLVAFYTKIFQKFVAEPFYRLTAMPDEECPWLAFVKMSITKNYITN